MVSMVCVPQSTFLWFLKVITKIGAGVALTSMGDYQSTFWGFLMTITSLVLATSKGLLANRFTNSGSIHIHPLQLVSRMAFLSAVYCFIYAYGVGEIDSIMYYYTPPFLRSLDEQQRQREIEDDIQRGYFWVGSEVIVNGILASLLNVVSFMCSQRISPLSMAVAANAKQIFVIITSTILFKYQIDRINGLGILLACVGGFLYR
jgi:hypothetical protein